MTQYIIRRLLISIPILLAVVFLVFLLARVLPGDPCVATLGERASEEQCRQFAIRFGLDQPLPVQFVRYLESIASGDLGISIRFRLPVADLIVQRLPTTMEPASTRWCSPSASVCRWASSRRIAATPRRTRA